MQTFSITYRLTLFDGESIEDKVEGICLEQSVELPRSVLSAEIAAKIVGEPFSQTQLSQNIYKVIIRWPVENIGGEITQFLNLLYGNISLKRGIKITEVAWSELPAELFLGPALGIEKLRAAFSIHGRALSATALKPMGSTVQELADKCYRFAKGGIDIIKDDHGLANQQAAPFQKRVEACVAAVRKAADETGRRARYFPNITVSGAKLLDRYKMAADAGADGVLVCPHLTGLAMMDELSKSDIPLPIIAHPAFSGSFVLDERNGLTPAFLYGQLWRALGADFVIYPNIGGRFSFTRDQCKAINASARSEQSPYNRSFPMPGGGLKHQNIHQWKNAYGKDTVLLMGSSLYNHPDGIEQAANQFTSALKS